MKRLWEISTTECAGSRENLMLRGNVYQLANGYMGYRGTLDEFGPEEAVGITLAGIFDQVGDAWREPVNAPNGAFSRVRLDGVALSALNDHVVRHRQTLHFLPARFERETVFQVGDKRLTLHSSRFLSADQPHLGVVRLAVSCDREAEVEVATGIDGNIWDLNGPHLRDWQFETEPAGVLWVQARTTEAGKRVAVAEALTATGDVGGATMVQAENRHLRRFAFRAAAGQAYHFEKYFAVFTDQQPSPDGPAAAAADLVARAQASGYASCWARHAAEWERRWQHGDVAIEGDDEAQLALRYSILQLLMVAPVAGSANSIPARALSGQVYKGAVFWDTEMFMLPFFLHTWPEKAAELLRYRIRTLDGARRKAQTEGPGYRGAFYAWESQDTGDDACTYFNIGDPITGRELRTHFRDKQVHISGDVALAMWQYFKLTGDDTLLRQGGAEVILECARFYYSYVHYKPDRGRYEVLDVIGPDEYHERVNNNAFTNQVVRETFAVAGALVAYLRSTYPAELQALLERIGLAEELPGFADAAARLHVPSPDAQTGVIEQFEGYFKLRDATVDELKAKMVHPHEYLGAGQGLAVPTKLIKQADVVMMLNLFRSRYPLAVKQANWRYYEPRTEHGSSLSACAYAMVATEIGDLEAAYRYFLRTATIDLHGNYKVYVGTIFTGGSHPAANGGAWMTAVFGFGGLLAEEDQVWITPRLPRGWRSLAFRLVYQGDCFHVRITPETVTVEPAAENGRSHIFRIGERTVTVDAGCPVTADYSIEPALSRSAER